MIRLRPKTDTSVTSVISQSTRKLPRIEPTATTMGSPAETRLPNTIARTTIVIGMATDSATLRSSVMVSLSAAPTASGPVTARVRPPWSPSMASSTASATSVRSSAEASGSANTMTWPIEPSSLRRAGGAPEVQ